MTAARVVVALLLFSTAAQAQRPVLLSGRVTDSSGTALAQVEVVVPDISESARTDSSGRFSMMVKPGSYMLVARRPGFVPFAWPIHVTDSLTVSIVLSPSATSLPRVVINGEQQRVSAKLSGFYERLRTSAAPRSSFVTRADLERRNPARLSDVIRERSGRNPACLRGTIYMDGAQMPQQSIFDPPAGKRRTVPEQRGPMDFIPATDVEAIEIYRSTATIPSQYNVTAPNGSPPACVVLIWTR